MKNLINQHAYLLVGLLAVLIQVLSYGLFEVNAESSLTIKTIILKAFDNKPPSSINTINEYKARLLWLASSLLSIAAYLVALVWSVMAIYRCYQTPHLYKIMGFGIAISALTLWRIGTADYHSAMYNNIFSTTYEALALSPLIGAALLTKIFVIISIINILATITPVFILMAICSAITLPTSCNQRDLAFFIQRVNYLEQGIVIGSMIMLFGIVHMAAWMQWPTALLDDSDFKKTLLASFSAIYQYWGIAFSLLLFALYACTMLYWREQTQVALRTHHPTIDVTHWLQENGFSLSWQKHALQLSAMLTPFLAGFSSSGMSLLSLH